MEQQEDMVTAFDLMYTTNHIQILKVILPFVETGMQHHLAVYIKYLELQYTLKHPAAKSFSADLKCAECPPAKQDKGAVLISLVKAIKPYLTEAELKQVQQIENMMNTMNQVQDMQKMMEMLSQSGLLQSDVFDENQLKNMEAMLHDFF